VCRKREQGSLRGTKSEAEGKEILRNDINELPNGMCRLVSWKRGPHAISFAE
jgi:hypothetical protein